MPCCAGSPTREAPRLLLPQKRKVFQAAGPCTPRTERAVTRHELWYRYVPASGNGHDGTCTRKIEAFSAATCTPWFGSASATETKKLMPPVLSWRLTPGGSAALL
jgi:hypothetical protein